MITLKCDFDEDRGVFAVRLSSNMKRGKKAEEAAAADADAADNEPDSGTYTVL